MTKANPRGFEDLDKPACHLRVQGARQLFRSDFKPYQVIVMANPELPEAKRAKSLFALFHNRQPFRRDLDAVGNARGEAGGGRAIPHRHLGAAGKFTDVGLGEARIEQRSQNFVLTRGALAGSPVALVVHVNAVSHRSEAALGDEFIEFVKQFVLAKVAAVGIVGAIGGVREFVGGDEFVRQLEARHDSLRLLPVALGVAGAQRRHRQHAVAQRLVRRIGEVRRVHPARIGNHQRRHLPQLFQQSLFLHFRLTHLCHLPYRITPVGPRLKYI